MFKKGDIVKQKVTGWEVILLNKNWKINSSFGEWKGKMWVPVEDGGYWKFDDFFECELE